MPRPTTPNSANAFQSYKVTSIPSEPVVVPDERLFPFPASISCERTRGTSNTTMMTGIQFQVLALPEPMMLLEHDFGHGRRQASRSGREAGVGVCGGR